jgi:hypothetical protein
VEAVNVPPEETAEEPEESVFVSLLNFTTRCFSIIFRPADSHMLECYLLIQ